MEKKAMIFFTKMGNINVVRMWRIQFGLEVSGQGE